MTSVEAAGGYGELPDRWLSVRFLLRFFLRSGPSAAGSSPVRHRCAVGSPSVRRRSGAGSVPVRERSGALAGAGPVAGRGPAGCRSPRAGGPRTGRFGAMGTRFRRAVRCGVHAGATTGTGRTRRRSTASDEVRRQVRGSGPRPYGYGARRRRPARSRGLRPRTPVRTGRRAEPRPDTTVREAPHASRTVRRPRGLKAAVSPSPLVPLPAGRPTRFSWKTSENPPARAHGRAHGHTPGARAPPLRPGAGTAAAPRR